MNKKVKVRFAPSPTGALHVGGCRTALFNYLFAKKHGGEFLLRIEDTDQKRFVAGAEKYIIDALSWLGISPDDGVNTDGTAKYRQSEREYKSYVDMLLSSGHAYLAFDTPEEMDVLREKAKADGSVFTYNSITRMSMRNSLTLSKEDVKIKMDIGLPYVIRFLTPKDKEISFTDSVKGLVTFNSNNMDDKILFKSDGLPTYHLANVVDDHLMEITHIIRGDEWLSSAALHIMLYEAFGWNRPEFCHLPLILGPDGKKLSKRHGDKYGFPVFPMTWDYVDEEGKNIHVTGFKDENYEPDALLNFLVLLGWNPGTEQEIMTMDEMISLFELDRINNSGAVFDIEKLKNFNAHYLRSKDSNSLLKVINKSLWKNLSKEGLDKIYNESELYKIIDIAKERSIFSTDLYGKVSYFFEPVVLKEDIVLKNDSEFRKVMECLEKGRLTHESDDKNLPTNWIADFIKSDMEAFCEHFGFKIGKVLPDLRTALTGGVPGPDLPTTMEILGREESFNRIKNLLKKTEKVAS